MYLSLYEDWLIQLQKSKISNSQMDDAVDGGRLNVSLYVV